MTQPGGLMKVLRAISVFIIILIIPVYTLAQGTGSAAVDFLNIGVSAKSSATGGAFSAIADGPVSSFYNPAGLASIENYQIAGMHTEWFQDLRYEYLGCGLPLSDWGGLGLSFSYLSYGTISGYSETGTSTGSIDAHDMALNLSYGHRVTERFYMGLGVKGISEKLDNISASGIAGDFGMQYRNYKYLIGLSVMNFGPKLKYDASSAALPTTVNAGVSYLPFGSDLSIMVGGSLPVYGEFSLKTGLEYSYENMIMLRTGYDTGHNIDGSSGISFGGGINVSNHNLDYAYNINDLMGGTHQISFVFKFGNPRKPGNDESPTPLRLNEAPVQDSYTPLENNISAEEIYTVPIGQIEVQENYTEPQKEKPEPIAKRYQVCAARYQNESSAQKHIVTLQKFGVKAWLYYDGTKEYRVVVGEADRLSKAEKMKSGFDKEGIFCFISEI